MAEALRFGFDEHSMMMLSCDDDEYICFGVEWMGRNTA